MFSDISPVSTHLASTCIGSFLYAIFLIFFATTVYSSIRPTWGVDHLAKIKYRKLSSPMMLLSFAMFVTITVHFVLIVFRLFEAFADFDDPVAYFNDHSQMSNILVTGFVAVVILIGDLMMVFRLWVVWNDNRLVILFPALMVTGVFGCGLLNAYQIGLDNPNTRDLPAMVSGSDMLVTALGAFSLAGNIYSSGLIFWKIQKSNRTTPAYNGSQLLSFADILIDSVTLYALIGIAYSIAWELRSNVYSLVADLIPSYTGIVFTMVPLRAEVRSMLTQSIPQYNTSHIVFRGIRETTAEPARGRTNSYVYPSFGSGEWPRSRRDTIHIPKRSRQSSFVRA